MPNQTVAQIKPGTGINGPGKTAKDHASGKHARRASNHAARAAWDRVTTASSRASRKAGDFPLDVCNGKRSRPLKKKEGL